MDTLYIIGIIYFIASMVDEWGVDRIRPRDIFSVLKVIITLRLIYRSELV